MIIDWGGEGVPSTFDIYCGITCTKVSNDPKSDEESIQKKLVDPDGDPYHSHNLIKYFNINVELS